MPRTVRAPERPSFLLRALAAAIVAALAALAGCSLDYGDGLAEDLSESVPDTVVHGFSHTVIEDGVPSFRIEAERAESYQGQRKMILSGVRFSEYGLDGVEPLSEGYADHAVFHTDTESAELSGSVRFYYVPDGLAVESGYLEWDGEARRLSSRADTVTTLRDDDGSGLSGSGFTADAASKSFEFGNRADGRFVAAEDPETAEDPEPDEGPDL